MASRLTAEQQAERSQALKKNSSVAMRAGREYAVSYVAAYPIILKKNNSKILYIISHNTNTDQKFVPRPFEAGTI